MITGDNIYTAINVGYKSSILSEKCDLWICTLEKDKLKWNFSNWENRIQKEENDEDFKSVVSSWVATKLG